MWMVIQGVGMNKITWGEFMGQVLSMEAETEEQRSSQLRERRKKSRRGWCPGTRGDLMLQDRRNSDNVKSYRKGKQDKK